MIPGANCVHCGGPGTTRFGNGYLCADCSPNGDAPVTGTGDTPNISVSNAEVCSCPTALCSHSPNPKRAAQFSTFLDRLDADGSELNALRFMPVDADTKAPAIEGTARLESEIADLFLHTAEEAYTAIYHGHPGFALYFGREDHGTEDLVAVDVDDNQEEVCQSQGVHLSIRLRMSVRSAAWVITRTSKFQSPQNRRWTAIDGYTDNANEIMTAPFLIYWGKTPSQSDTVRLVPLSPPYSAPGTDRGIGSGQYVLISCEHSRHR